MAEIRSFKDILAGQKKYVRNEELAKERSLHRLLTEIKNKYGYNTESNLEKQNISLAAQKVAKSIEEETSNVAELDGNGAEQLYKQFVARLDSALEQKSFTSKDKKYLKDLFTPFLKNFEKEIVEPKLEEDEQREKQKTGFFRRIRDRFSPLNIAATVASPIPLLGTALREAEQRRREREDMKIDARLEVRALESEGARERVENIQRKREETKSKNLTRNRRTSQTNDFIEDSMPTARAEDVVIKDNEESRSEKRDRMEDLGLGERGVPYLKTLIETITDSNGANTSSQKGMGGMFKTIGTVLMSVVGGLATLISSGAGLVTGLISSLVTSIIPVLATVGRTLITALIPAISAAIPVLLPFILAALAGYGLAKIMQMLGTGDEEILQKDGEQGLRKQYGADGDIVSPDDEINITNAFDRELEKQKKEDKNNLPKILGYDPNNLTNDVTNIYQNMKSGNDMLGLTKEDKNINNQIRTLTIDKMTREINTIDKQSAAGAFLNNNTNNVVTNNTNQIFGTDLSAKSSDPTIMFQKYFNNNSGF